MEDTIRIPVKATYHIVEGEPVRVSAEYEEIPTMELVKVLLRGFSLLEVKKD